MLRDDECCPYPRSDAGKTHRARMSGEPPPGVHPLPRSRIDTWRRRGRELWSSLRGRGSPARLGVSVGVGLFIGCLPLYGLHVWLCLAICLPLRLDAVAAGLASNVSNPFVAPFLIVAEVQLGSYLLRGEPASLDLSRATLQGIADLLYEAALGGVIIGALLALLGGWCVALLARRAAERESVRLRVEDPR
jgi:uncharacterized protein